MLIFLLPTVVYGLIVSPYLANFPLGGAVLSEIPVEFHAADSKSLRDHSVTSSVLGLSWNLILYVFNFKVQSFDPVSKLTKWIVLSRTAQVFDRMGWLSLIIITPKILIQSLWLVKVGWDDELCQQHRPYRYSSSELASVSSPLHRERL